MQQSKIDGFLATKQIKKKFPLVKVIALTMYSEEEYISEMLKTGANAYVLKESSAVELIEAIRAVNSGKIFLSHQLRRYEKQKPSTFGDKFEDLTPREIEVLKLLADGKALKQVADILEVSFKTADTHKTNLMRKLNIHNRTELIKYAIKCGILKIKA